MTLSAIENNIINVLQKTIDLMRVQNEELDKALKHFIKAQGDHTRLGTEETESNLVWAAKNLEGLRGKFFDELVSSSKGRVEPSGELR